MYVGKTKHIIIWNRGSSRQQFASLIKDRNQMWLAISSNRTWLFLEDSYVIIYLRHIT